MELVLHDLSGKRACIRERRNIRGCVLEAYWASYGLVSRNSQGWSCVGRWQAPILFMIMAVSSDPERLVYAGVDFSVDYLGDEYRDRVSYEAS